MAVETVDQTVPPANPAVPVEHAVALPPADHHPTTPPPKKRRWLLPVIVVAVVILLLVFGLPALLEAMSTVSTDDAYVNGHATFVAARVGGQVSKVFVDENNRVRKGDLIVQLDKEPYQVQLALKKAALATAEANFRAAQASVRAIEADARSHRWKLQHSMEDVINQIALLKSTVAALESAKAVASRASADYARTVPLAGTGALSAEEVDRRKQVMAVADAQVKQSLQAVYQIRVSLGLPAVPATGEDLAQVPEDLDQTFSSVRQAEAELMQVAAQVGVEYSFDTTPRKLLEDFLKRDPEGNIDRIYATLLKDAPAIRQAEGKLTEAHRDVDQAELNLRYTDVVAEIDGVVTRRNVNPGNNIVAGQELMVIRSLNEIWIDANFKETELSELRIGLPVDLSVDMYGKKKIFKGRITGFTMGTGSTLALLPAQNATGNFVKVVQRLPVRIDLENYDPENEPLFVGLSVEPRVHFKEKPTGPDAGKLLQPYAMTAALAIPTSQPTTVPAKTP